MGHIIRTHHTPAVVAARIICWTNLVGIALFFAVQTCLTIANMVTMVYSGVSSAATGASYVGMGPLVFRLQTSYARHFLWPQPSTMHSIQQRSLLLDHSCLWTNSTAYNFRHLVVPLCHWLVAWWEHLRHGCYSWSGHLSVSYAASRA